MGSLRQAAKSLASAAGHRLAKPVAADLGLARARTPAWQTQTRGFAGLLPLNRLSRLVNLGFIDCTAFAQTVCLPLFHIFMKDALPL